MHMSRSFWWATTRGFDLGFAFSFVFFFSSLWVWLSVPVNRLDEKSKTRLWHYLSLCVEWNVKLFSLNSVARRQPAVQCHLWRVTEGSSSMLLPRRCGLGLSEGTKTCTSETNNTGHIHIRRADWPTVTSRTDKDTKAAKRTQLRAARRWHLHRYYIPGAWLMLHARDNFTSRHKCDIFPSPQLPVLLAVTPAFVAVRIWHSHDRSRNAMKSLTQQVITLDDTFFVWPKSLLMKLGRHLKHCQTLSDHHCYTRFIR